MDLPRTITSAQSRLISAEPTSPGSRASRLEPTLTRALADKQSRSPQALHNPSKVCLTSRPLSRPQPSPKPNSAAARGFAWERKAIARLTTDYPNLPFQFHRWISYEDRSRMHGAEPDGFAVWPDWVLLVEFKLTGCAYGKAQMENLYAPLLRILFPNRPIRCLQICKNLSPDTPGPFQAIETFLDSSAPYATWNWLR